MKTLPSARIAELEEELAEALSKETLDLNTESAGDRLIRRRLLKIEAVIGYLDECREAERRCELCLKFCACRCDIDVDEAEHNPSSFSQYDTLVTGCDHPEHGNCTPPGITNVSQLLHNRGCDMNRIPPIDGAECNCP